MCLRVCVQDADYVADVIGQAIGAAAPGNIIQVVLDGAAVCTTADRLLEDRYIKASALHM